MRLSRPTKPLAPFPHTRGKRAQTPPTPFFFQGHAGKKEEEFSLTPLSKANDCFGGVGSTGHRNTLTFELKMERYYGETNTDIFYG